MKKTSLKTDYWKPTPKWARKLGDSLLAVSTFGIPAIMMDFKWLGISMFVIGIIGKFLSNFFAE